MCLFIYFACVRVWLCMCARVCACVGVSAVEMMSSNSLGYRVWWRRWDIWSIWTLLVLSLCINEDVLRHCEWPRFRDNQSLCNYRYYRFKSRNVNTFSHSQAPNQFSSNNKIWNDKLRLLLNKQDMVLSRNRSLKGYPKCCFEEQRLLSMWTRIESNRILIETDIILLYRL